MLTAQEVYAAARALPLPERLRLAALILDEMTQLPSPSINPQELPGYSDVWTEEDRMEFAAHCARQAAFDLPDDDDLLPPPEELKRLEAEYSHV